jgi:hypothetical protein
MADSPNCHLLKRMHIYKKIIKKDNSIDFNEEFLISFAIFEST